MFPIPFRLLEGEHQFARWEWIRARITKSRDDHRPESYKVDVDSIERITRVGTESGWAERLEWIQPHFAANFDSLETGRLGTGKTMGFIRPLTFKLEIRSADTPDWTREEQDKLFQDGLFDNQTARNRLPLRKVPFDFYYSYTCDQDADTGINICRHKITDWEASALYWNCQKLYGEDWEKFYRQRLEEDFQKNKELIFMLGTMHRFPKQWLIVGLVYPPKVDARQQALFLTPPGV